jgi:hypothetical protein
MATDGVMGLPMIASGGSVAGRSWPASVAGGGGSYETSLLWLHAANFLRSIAWASLLIYVTSALGETLDLWDQSRGAPIIEAPLRVSPSWWY